MASVYNDSITALAEALYDMGATLGPKPERTPEENALLASLTRSVPICLPSDRAAQAAGSR